MSFDADSDSGDASSDDEVFAALGDHLASGVDEALPGWVEASVRRIHDAWAGSTPEPVSAEAVRAGEDAREAVGAALRRLLALDIDEQKMNPMTIVREAGRFPTAVLSAAGVPPVQRDDTSERMFPNDIYDLMPTSFGELDPDLQAVGLAWGAAKAKVHLGRRRDRTG